VLTLTYASVVAGCFLSTMETTGSWHGQDTSIGCIRMTENGITPLTAFALIQRAREAWSSMPCMISTSETINFYFESSFIAYILVHGFALSYSILV
jgi:hypothetical protein